MIMKRVVCRHLMHFFRKSLNINFFQELTRFENIYWRWKVPFIATLCDFDVSGAQLEMMSNNPSTFVSFSSITAAQLLIIQG